MRRKIIFTPEMQQYVAKNYKTTSSNDMANYLGVDRGVVGRFMKRMGFQVSKEQSREFAAAKLRGKTSFSQKQDKFIRDNYLTIPVKRLAKELGKSGCGVQLRLKAMNLVIPRDVIEQRKKDSQLKKGHVPVNKGKKQTEYMSIEAIERTKGTRFKKGNEPHNTKKDGIIVTRLDSSGRNYKYIRIKKGVWELYHRIVWERANGKIPDNHLVVFKDDNTENTSIENLELITMTENMYRNSKHNYPKEIIPSLVLNRQLENKLNTLQNG